MAENFIDGSGDTPISWWMLEDASSPLQDGSTNNNDLAYTAGSTSVQQTSPTPYQGSYSVRALSESFDTPRCAFASLSSNFPMKAATTALTVGGWVYFYAYLVDAAIFRLINTTANQGFQFYNIAAGRPGFFFQQSTGSSVSWQGTAFSTPDWHHLVARWNGDNRAGAGANDELSLWVDGNKQATTRTFASVTSAVNGDGFWLYAYGVENHNFDEMFIFDLALQDTQISDIYAHGLDGTRDVFTPSGLSAVDGDERYFPKFKLRNPITAGRVI